MGTLLHTAHTAKVGGQGDRYTIWLNGCLLYTSMENADIIKTIDIGENSGLLAEKDGLITIAWSCDDYYFVLLSRVGESETTKIAESVKIQK